MRRSEQQGASQGEVGHDLLIAATALAWDAAVLTDNAREFGHVPGLKAQKPAWPE